MMEPVARIDAEALKELEKHPDAAATVWSGKARNQFAKGAVPLVRLSDTEARIRELEAKIELLELEAEGNDNAKRDLAEVLNCSDEPRWKYMRHEAVMMKARAEAAEALLKEVVTAWEVLPAWHHTARVVERWLANDMNPVIDKIRAAHAISGKIGGGE